MPRLPARPAAGAEDGVAGAPTSPPRRRTPPTPARALRAPPRASGRGGTGSAGGRDERAPRPRPERDRARKARSAAASAAPDVRVKRDRRQRGCRESGRTAGEPVRAVAKAVAVQVRLRVVGPVVAVERPCRCAVRRATAARGCRRRSCPRIAFARKRQRRQGDVRLRDRRCARNVLRSAPSMKTAARVVGNQVVLGENVLAVLEQESHRREAAVVDEAVAAERETPARYMIAVPAAPSSNTVVLEDVVVREHVVEPVAQVVRAVAARPCRARRLDVDAVADVGDVVLDQA